MKSILKSIIITGLFAFSQQIVFSQDADKTVTLIVTGQGKTIDDAKTNALRSAIEQAFGAFISSNTTILNDKLVRDEIVSVTNGNIQKFEILSENVLPNGIQSVLLNATVSISKLTTFSQAKGIKIEFEGGLFAANIKQKILNEDAEIRSIWNTLFTLNPILRKAFDYKISNKEPTSENGNSTFNLELQVEIYTNNNIDLVFSYLKNFLSKIAMNSEQANEYVKLNKPVFTVNIDSFIYILRRNESLLAIKYFFDDIPAIQRGFIVEDGISQTTGSNYYFNRAVNRGGRGNDYWGDINKSFHVKTTKTLEDFDLKESDNYQTDDLVSGFEKDWGDYNYSMPENYSQYNIDYVSKSSNIKVKSYTLKNNYSLVEIEKIKTFRVFPFSDISNVGLWYNGGRVFYEDTSNIFICPISFDVRNDNLQRKHHNPNGGDSYDYGRYWQEAAEGNFKDYSQLLPSTKTSVSLGSGKGNTEELLKIIFSSNIPQSICSKLNFWGYSDWFLPSAQEMVQLMIFAKTAYNIRTLDARQYMTSTLDKESQGPAGQFYSIQPNLKNEYGLAALFRSESYISFVPIRMEKLKNVDTNK